MSKSVAIVTGASQGIGRATALRLSRDFSALVLVARNRANLEETAEKVRAGGADALIIDADMALPEAAQSVVDQAPGVLRPHRRPAQHRGRRAPD
jgi:short-subunit dehydrogenase